MSASPDQQAGDELQGRRRRARRTAIVIAVLAVAIYAAFMISGILSQ